MARGQRTIKRDGKTMKAIANRETFVIIITAATLLLGNVYLGKAGRYQAWYQGVVAEETAGTVHPSCQ